jgi:hypothetical protein
MIKEIRVLNFRGFERLEVSGLQRINILTGCNGSGKTSFLEALFMSAGSGALALWFKLRLFRQLSNKIQLTGDTSGYESLWEDMFYGIENQRTIEIRAIGDDNDSRSVRIFNEHRSVQLLFQEGPPVSSSKPQIASEWQRNEDTPVVVRPKIEPQGIVFENQSQDHFPILFFGPHIADPAEDNALRFSQLSRNGTLSEITRVLCDEFDFIESLSLEYTSGGPSVFAKLKDKQHKLPLAVVSDGVNKLFSLLLGIAVSENGIVLIDQIEDGFYYKKFESMWRVIYSAAKKNNCQLFITSHNGEALRALLPTIHKNEKDFTMLHSDRTRGIIQFHTVEGKYFAATLDQGLEIR